MGGWLVGKSDFNESPVVSPDLDLDFGLLLRVCQKQKKGNISAVGAPMQKIRILYFLPKF